MKRIVVIGLLTASLIVFCTHPTPAESRKSNVKSREPDSEYVDKEKPKAEGGGLLDFLPFFGNHTKKVEPEQLTPSPLPEESKPVLSKEDLDQLREAANRWLTTSEITEPAVRQDEAGKFYRDYVVFANEYKIDVLRGSGQETPFVAHVYVQGDYFKTKLYDSSEEAQADFDFKYQPLDFRVVFERVEKWEYSANPDEEPFKYIELWEFRKLQSRAKVDLLSQDQSPVEPAEKSAPAPQPSGK